jgi:hypothetical protein
MKIRRARKLSVHYDNTFPGALGARGRIAMRVT